MSVVTPPGEVAFLLAAARPARLRVQEQVERSRRQLAAWLCLVVAVLAVYDGSLLVHALHV